MNLRKMQLLLIFHAGSAYLKEQQPLAALDEFQEGLKLNTENTMLRTMAEDVSAMVETIPPTRSISDKADAKSEAKAQEITLAEEAF